MILVSVEIGANINIEFHKTQRRGGEYMEQLKLFDTGEDRDHGCANRLTEQVNNWLCKLGDSIIITHRQIAADGNGYPMIWIFYKKR